MLDPDPANRNLDPYLLIPDPDPHNETMSLSLLLPVVKIQLLASTLVLKTDPVNFNLNPNLCGYKCKNFISFSERVELDLLASFFFLFFLCLIRIRLLFYGSGFKQRKQCL